MSTRPYKVLKCTVFVLSLLPQQATVLSEGVSGFVFESNRGVRASVIPEHPLGSQFKFSWMGQKTKKIKTKAEQAADRVGKMALELQGRYFSVTQESTRKIAAELRGILGKVEEACSAHDEDTVKRGG